MRTATAIVDGGDPAPARTASRVLDGVVDEIGDGLADQLPVGADRRACCDFAASIAKPASSATGS